jgi:hypothetical protein
MIKASGEITSFNTALIFGAPASPGPATASVATQQKWIDQEMVAGVPNKLLIGGAAGLLLLVSLRKGKRR